MTSTRTGLVRQNSRALASRKALGLSTHLLPLTFCVASLSLACGGAEEARETPATQQPALSPGNPAPSASAPGAQDPMAAAPAVEPSAPSNNAEQPSSNLPIAPAPTGAGSTPPASGGAMAGMGEMPPAATPPPATPPPATPPPATPPVPVAPGDLPAITVWIAGDSTVANGLTPCPKGWGGVFAQHFDPRVTIKNSAVGGRSVNTWLYNVQTTMDAAGECNLARGANGEPTLQPRWQEMLDGMKAGDYLFIQFGINDSSATCDRHVGLEAFKDSYGMMALAAKERGAQPVFLTPVSSIACNGTQARGSRGGFVPATMQAGAEFGVPVIDLHQRSVDLFQARGFCPVAGGDVSAATTGPVGDFFCDDHTHFSPTGAVEIGNLVVQALRDQSIPLAAYLR